jgi:F0F1-type ATP synthase epsilon subunit
MKNVDTISVTVMSPNAVVWEGEALSLSSANSEGEFDIMPDHARFMTMIEGVPLIVRENSGKDRSFSFKTALLFFQDNLAKIYIHETT